MVTHEIARSTNVAGLSDALGDPKKGSRLENTANNLSPGDRRRLRFERREVLWRASGLQRVRHCGRVPRSLEDGVQLRCREGVGGYAGLQHCGSVWADPVCAGRILLHRSLEIGAVLGQAVAQGHPLGFITLTMRHHLAQALALLWAAGQKGWQRAISGKGWVAVQPLVEGWVRVWEVSFSWQNGWHVHIHMVVVLAKGANEQDLEEVAGGIYNRWSRGLVAGGLEAPMRIGQDWHLVEGAAAPEALGEYLAKMADQPEAASRSLGLELTHSMPGRSSKGLGTAPVWALLDQLVSTGEAEPLERWREWERVSKGKRQVGWSKGLRERFAPEIESLGDDEIVAQELGTADDALVHFDARGWREMVAVPGRPVLLLESVERGGTAGARALLDQWGVPYEMLEPEVRA